MRNSDEMTIEKTRPTLVSARFLARNDKLNLDHNESCENIDSIENGDLICSNNNLARSVCKIQCNYGFVLNASAAKVFKLFILKIIWTIYRVNSEKILISEMYPEISL